MSGASHLSNYGYALTFVKQIIGDVADNLLVAPIS
jgi:hypothetical protein